MRMISVIGALVLASCLAFPAGAVSYDENVRLDAIAHAGADFIAPAFEPVAFAVEAMDLAVLDSDMLVRLSPGGDEDEPAAPAMLGSWHELGLIFTAPRRHDPGWSS